MKKVNPTAESGISQSAQKKEIRSEKSMLRDLLIRQLKDLYWAETHLLTALPKMKEAATTTLLMQAFSNHLSVTEKQVSKLEKIFTLLEEKAQSNKCEAMEGLTRDADDMINETEEGTLTRDAGLIIAAQRVEHYEIASYGSLAHLANTIGEFEVAEMLEEILEEEEEADDALTQLAIGNVSKPKTSDLEPEEEEEEEEEEEQDEEELEGAE
jgi:ferritin-like metal-binding protein YciE